MRTWRGALLLFVDVLFFGAAQLLFQVTNFRVAQPQCGLLFQQFRLRLIETRQSTRITPTLLPMRYQRGAVQRPEYQCGSTPTAVRPSNRPVSRFS